MESFKKTTLWKSAFCERQDDSDPDARKKLCASFLDLRSRAETLVSQIATDIRDLTVHDITHLDALWETASLIAGDDFTLNPAEGYVLGGAILLHDAAMSLAAYPGGLSDLTNTDEWRDTVALILPRGDNEPQSIDNPSSEVVAEAIPIVLRALHAKQAEQLPVTAWPGPGPNAAPEHLIQDSDLRRYYGRLIGRIAASHWWDVSDLEDLPSTCNAGPGLPASWAVDPRKIACLLRVADAAHIDHRRAPRWLRTLLRPRGESGSHWTFQEKLGKPRREGDALVYTGSEFVVNDADAWWLCFDTIQMIDRELRKVDNFLEESGRTRFAADHVKAAESPVRLARFIRTAGWQPVDTSLRVSDVPALVERFGGKQLYGDDPKVALRELIQNAADAIRARRCIKGTPAGFGVISVALQERENGVWLEVQDNGIGMRASVLTGALLDFGVSLWRSNTMLQEHPGLIGRGLNTTGRFGIGFFSVFMLGEHVKVTSRRHDAALADMRTLEFQHGLSSRPVLRDPNPDEQWPDCGTRVSVRLFKAPDDDGGLLPHQGKSNSIDLAALVTSLCPTLDVSIEVADRSGTGTRVLEADDWVSLSKDQLLTRVRQNSVSTQEEIFANNLRTLQSPDDHLFGRAYIQARPRYLNHVHGVVTIGGLQAGILNHIGGVLEGGESETLTRDSTIPTVPLSVLSEWATEQASLLCAFDATDRSKVVCAQIVFALGGDPGDLPIGLRRQKGITRAELQKLLQNTDTIHVFEEMDVEYDEDKDPMHRRHFDDGFTPEPGVLFLTTTPPNILTVGTRQWPMCLPDYALLPGARTPWNAFVSLVKEVWGEEFDEEIDEAIEECRIGRVDDYHEIMRDVTVFSKPVRIPKSMLKNLRFSPKL